MVVIIVNIIVSLEAKSNSASRQRYYSNQKNRNVMYSKPSICLASQGKGLRPGK